MLRAPDQARRDLANRGYAWLPQSGWHLEKGQSARWNQLRADWDQLEPDNFLSAGATFRRRRFGRFYWFPPTGELVSLPHQAYFQPKEQNAYAGGRPREFAPLLPATANDPFLCELVREMFRCLPLGPDKRASAWEVRVHQIRIVGTPEEAGQPAPEGIHQDGTDFLTLHLVRRENVAGGVTTIYDLNQNPIERLTLQAPLDSLVLDDPRLLHGVTPIRPADGSKPAVRDVLGLDFIFSPELSRPAISP